MITVRAFLISLYLVTSSVFVHAESSSISASASSDGTSSTSMKEILKNKKFEETREITDAKMKAEAGSLSQFSLKGTLSYYGPTVGDIDAKDQPNPDGAVGTYETALGGSVGMRFRFNSSSSLSAGTGLKVIHPLHGAERTDVSTPYLSYDYTQRVGQVQMRHSPGVSVVTLPVYVRAGEVAGLNYDFSSVYNLQDSHFAIGLDTSVSYYLFYRTYEKKDGNLSGGALSLYPTLKYIFNDHWSANTSTTLAWSSPRNRPGETVLLPKTVSQRLGVGYGYSRDIYISPYLTIYPTRMAWDTTTMNISTSFSLL